MKSLLRYDLRVIKIKETRSGQDQKEGRVLDARTAMSLLLVQVSVSPELPVAVVIDFAELNYGINHYAISPCCSV